VDDAVQDGNVEYTVVVGNAVSTDPAYSVSMPTTSSS
jgi:acyl transferase domain-containing protein